LRGEIERVADFLGKSLSGEQLARLVAHLRFENFAKNESVNYEGGKQLGFMNQEGRFIRKGTHDDTFLEYRNCVISIL
jgi:estrone sulfotransferase